MSMIQLIVLALIQGLTEFLPISSSAHLILGPELLGWPDQGLMLDVAAHLGTLVAVLIYFRNDLLAMLRSLGGEGDARDRELLGYLVIASVPALAAGYLAADFIATHLRSPQIIAVTTLVFGLVLWVADRYGQRTQTLESMNWRHALAVGAAQVLALVPGTSRAGITMSMALALGYRRVASARFSFLLAIPLLAGAGGYSAVKVLQQESAVSFSQFSIVAGLSAVVALSCIWLFLKLVERVGMTPFVIYRVLLGLLLLYLFF